jgi:hypothetical protein
LVVRVRGADIRSSTVEGRVAGLGAWGVIHTPGLVEFFSKLDKAGQSHRWRGDPDDFLMEGAGDVLAEGIHLGFFVCARPVSVGGPFLV